MIEQFGNRVQEGPFAGMILTNMTYDEQIGPYLLGVYESELDKAWQTVFRGSYLQIVDIGSKFGYYAVGLAKKYPDASVIAFDTDWWARKALSEMIVANGAANVTVMGFCSPQWIAENIQENALIISDCEGYEEALFGADPIRCLHFATLVIETHDCFVPGVSERLRNLFSRTHCVQVFDENSVRRGPTQPLEFLTEPERSLAMHEVRPPQVWLLCLPKSGRNEHLHLA